MLALQIIIRLSAWLALLIIGDLCFKAMLTFVLTDEFKQAHEYRELLCLRALEIMTLLILTRHQFVSIFGIKSKLKKEILLTFGFTSLLIGGFVLLTWILKFLGLNIFESFIVQSENNHFDFELLLIAVLLGPLIEEYCFRGLLWSDLSVVANSRIAKFFIMLLVALPFVFLHLNMAHSLTSQIPLIFMWSCCALCTLLLYEWRKSILLGLGLHASANACIYFGHYLI